MRVLDSQQLVDFIKVRQLRQVRALRQAQKLVPKLVFIDCGGNEVWRADDIQAYAQDILVEVDTRSVALDQLADQINDLNTDESVFGVVANCDPSALRGLVAAKDIAACKSSKTYARPVDAAVDWLLAGYNVELVGKHVLAIVDEPDEQTAKLWQSRGLNVTFAGLDDEDVATQVNQADVIIIYASTGSAITSSIVKNKTVIIFAGDPKTVSEEAYSRDDLAATSPKDGLRPLITCALFDNLIRAVISFSDSSRR